MVVSLLPNVVTHVGVLVVDGVTERRVAIDEDAGVFGRVVPLAVPDVDRKVEAVLGPQRWRAIFGDELLPRVKPEPGHVLADEVAVVAAERLGSCVSVG